MIIFIGIFLLIIFYVIVVEIRNRKLLHTVTFSNRGTRSERSLVLTLLKSGVPAITIFHDLYLKNNNGKYSQIDLVVATKVGLIVFEVKEYSGWIFGTGNQPKWTQILAFGKRKYQFYNPILQNNKHISDLKNQVKQFEYLQFYSIVVFYGDCKFKDVSFIPKGTYLIKSNRVKEVMRMIQTENPPANYTNKREVLSVLNEAVKTGENKQIQIQHIANVEDMLGHHRIFE